MTINRASVVSAITRFFLRLWYGLRGIAAFLLLLLAPLLALSAAVGKGCGHGWRIMWLFSLIGAAIVMTSFLSALFFWASFAFALAIFLVSLNMEGWAVMLTLYRLAKRISPNLVEGLAEVFEGSKKKARDFLERLKNRSDMPSYIIKRFVLVIIFFLMVFAALGKGASIAYGLIEILSEMANIAPLSIEGIIVIICTGLLVAFVCLAKEALLLFEKYRNWCRPVEDGRVAVWWWSGDAKDVKAKKKTQIDFPGWLRRFLAGVLPVLAAFVKGFGYGFGVQGLLCLILGISISGLSLWVALGVSLPFVPFIALSSLWMEGRALNMFIKECPFNDATETDKKQEERTTRSFFDADKSRWFAYRLSLVCPVVTASAKGATMCAGTIGIAMLFLGSPATPIIWAVGIIVGGGAFFVSLLKEGRILFYTLNGFKKQSVEKTTAVSKQQRESRTSRSLKGEQQAQKHGNTYSPSTHRSAFGRCRDHRTN